eukprot:TRINITY_DN42725_c0_g1_i1.p1 TRINITY_DN42725_c0_g1~~TRINITY_DN42725_c0_g1_i1.p1  ORF type:complete len:122 (-),score=9.33 TRINITY_DN42725_c0_g1_i1:45-371(-)
MDDLQDEYVPQSKTRTRNKRPGHFSGMDTTDQEFTSMGYASTPRTRPRTTHYEDLAAVPTKPPAPLPKLNLVLPKKPVESARASYVTTMPSSQAPPKPKKLLLRLGGQ